MGRKQNTLEWYAEQIIKYVYLNKKFKTITDIMKANNQLNHRAEYRLALGILINQKRIIKEKKYYVFNPNHYENKLTSSVYELPAFKENEEHYNEVFKTEGVTGLFNSLDPFNPTGPGHDLGISMLKSPEFAKNVLLLAVNWYKEAGLRSETLKKDFEIFLNEIYVKPFKVMNKEKNHFENLIFE